MVSDGADGVIWGEVTTTGIADKAVTAGKINAGASEAGQALVSNGSGSVSWGAVGMAGIAASAADTCLSEAERCVLSVDRQGNMSWVPYKE